MEGASFVGADLRGANLGVASLFGASFGRRDDRGRLELARIDAATNFNPADLECLTDEQLEFFRLMEARYAPG